MKTRYRSTTYIPEVVKEAKSLALKHDFQHSCTDEVGRFLAVLVSQIKQGKVLEIGTGFGVGSAWMLSAISPQVKLISVDHSKEKINYVQQVLSKRNTSFVNKDWKQVISSGPFQLIFADVSSAKLEDCEILFSILDEGGMLIMDDFTPEEYFPDEWKGKPDKVREYWLNHEGLVATEIYVSTKASVILATKKEQR